MKVKCVTNKYGDNFTTGKEYEVTKNEGDRWIVRNNAGEEWSVLPQDFALLPDEPAPKSEWMQINGNEYVDLKTGVKLTFFRREDDSVHSMRMSNIQNNGAHFAYGSFADSFAALVCYDWPSAGKEM
jgi:hypothetical protein